MSDLEFDLDLGHGHTLRWLRWAPDRDLNPQYVTVPDIDRYGATIHHTSPAGEACNGGIVFDTPEVAALHAISGGNRHATWQVASWEPLTLSPSILCSCGDHGFIRDGQWVAA